MDSTKKNRLAKAMKILFLLVCLLISSAIDIQKDEGYPLAKFDEIRGKYIVYQMNQQWCLR